MIDHWLRKIEGLHPSEIELGLKRTREVFDRLTESPCLPSVITIAGTNGKGSTASFLEHVLRASGLRVGVYTSPHLLRFNERIRLCGREISDTELCQSFERVESARQGIPLTYFEFTTLAALHSFGQNNLDVIVLEAGLGGRLDAVNIIDADVAIVTSIGKDHTEWLGETLDAIALEKAGIFRKGRSAICGDPSPPQNLIDHAVRTGSDLHLFNRDFGVEDSEHGAIWWGKNNPKLTLPTIGLAGQAQTRNAACAVMALSCLDPCQIDATSIARGLKNTRLQGRFQTFRDHRLILDVAHNGEAASHLSSNLAALPPARKTHAIFGVLEDKHIQEIILAMTDTIDIWHCIALPTPRSANPNTVEKMIHGICPEAETHTHSHFTAALETTGNQTYRNDRIVVFGSFFSVSEGLKALITS